MTEIPLYAPGPSEAPSASEPKGPSRLDLETLRWLAREPTDLHRRIVDRPLQKAIRGAIDRGSLAPLAALGERQRREILETVERRIGSRPAAGSTARLIVHLTSALAPLPPTDLGSLRQLSVPAR